jgi:hypothetical protein
MDSLDLMVDTMCNIFAAIVLIACFIALLARDEPPPPDAAGAAKMAIVQRDLDTARSDLEALQQAVERATQELPPETAANMARLASLRTELAELELKVRGAQQNLDHAVQSNSDASADELGHLTVETSKIRPKVENLEGAVADGGRLIAQLEERLKLLNQQLRQEVTTQTAQVRFPREKKKTKESSPMIVRYGKLFPVALGGTASSYVSLEPLPFGVLIKPIESKGLTPVQSGEILRILDVVRAKSAYPAFYVYPDSYDAFRRMKELVLSRQMEFGMDLMKADSNIISSSGGGGDGPPPPL